MKFMVPAAWVCCAFSAMGQTWLESADFNKAVIVVADDDSDAAYAVGELSRYWEALSGTAPPASPTPVDGAVTIYIGDAAHQAPGADSLGLDTLGEQGICIKTLSPTSLVIAGGSDLGDEYAVLQFIEDYLGVRWLAPDCTYVPETAPDIPVIDLRYEPVFEYRYSTYQSSVEGIDAFRRVHRWNMGPGFSAHTAYALVPPEKYFPDHPEYFSEIDGERIAPWDIDYHSMDARREHGERMAQLCMTNPDVIDIIANTIKERIRANPEVRVHHVSQEDWFSYCQCARCAAIDAEEESHMGAPMYGLNRIAESVAAEFPGYGVETLAYQFTRKPPKHMRPVDNLYIKLCSIECDFSKPLSDPDSRSNRQFADDIRAWAAIAPRLHVWDYTTNFRNFQSPIPNFDVIQPNIRFFAANKVRAMYEQGSYDAGAEFAQLRCYLISKLMWNPDLDVAAARDEFLRLYYGPAAPQIGRYLTLLDEKVAEDHAVVGCFDPAGWYDAGLIAQADPLLQEALAAVQGDREKELRVRRVYATVQFARIKCPAAVSVEGGELIQRRPPCQTMDEYTAMLTELGVKNVVDFFPFEEIYRQIGRQVPPREARTSLVTVETDATLLWVLPERNGAIIRWQDKATGAELLRGYESLDLFPCTWTEWTSRKGVREEAAVEKYAVTAKTGNTLILSGQTPDGLRIDREIRLEPDGAVHGLWNFTNTADTSIPCPIKIHPEFWAQGNHVPEIWTHGPAGWAHRTGVTDDGEPLRFERFEAAPFDGFAAYMAHGDLLLASHFTPGAITGLNYFLNIDSPAQQVNLEAVVDPSPLAPRTSRRVAIVYRVSNGRPE